MNIEKWQKRILMKRGWGYEMICRVEFKLVCLDAMRTNHKQMWHWDNRSLIRQLYRKNEDLELRGSSSIDRRSMEIKWTEVFVLKICSAVSSAALLIRTYYTLRVLRFYLLIYVFFSLPVGNNTQQRSNIAAVALSRQTPCDSARFSFVFDLAPEGQGFRAPRGGYFSNCLGKRLFSSISSSRGGSTKNFFDSIVCLQQQHEFCIHVSFSSTRAFDIYTKFSGGRTGWVFVLTVQYYTLYHISAIVLYFICHLYNCTVLCYKCTVLCILSHQVYCTLYFIFTIVLRFLSLFISTIVL